MADPNNGSGNGNSNGNNEEVNIKDTFKHAGADVYIHTDDEGNQDIAYGSDISRAISDSDDDNDDDTNNSNGGNGNSKTNGNDR